MTLWMENQPIAKYLQKTTQTNAQKKIANYHASDWVHSACLPMSGIVNTIETKTIK
jgi:hypothetical protein